ncbi:hypothetical protein CY34DRAFT_17668 [Suillus luteus UH-Slu-Lm8-n1]|uniref:Uncharacterized protein n=1 Tax=Suillus luteus UH-Slu-Lm8-n1 TaxID=930992 RepID=A0A0D0A8S0_9AGAM|nr:hypothetical protein CY34DRAFT_17668 [Suillus luteus UH-Slu-Lm8-n1]
MTQSTPNASSHSSKSSNAAQHMPNTGMHMGQFPWPQPGYIPHSGFDYPPPNVTHGAALKDAPVAPLPVAGLGVAHHVSSFPGAANPYAPPMQHQGYLYQHQGPGLATGFAPALVPQEPGLSAGKKRVTEDLGGRHTKRTKNKPRRGEERPAICELSFDLFSCLQTLGQRPMLDEHGQPDGKFICVKDGMVLNPQSYLKHIKTKKLLGGKLEIFKCHVCSMTYARLDSCKRHFYNRECGKAAAGGPPPSFSAGLDSVSSDVVAPPMVPTMAFT